MPVSQMGGQGRVFLVIPEIHYLDAERTGVEPGVVMPATASGVPGPLAVGHQLVDRERLLVGVAGEQVVGAHLVLRFGQQAQGAGILFIRVVQDEKGDAFVLAGALMLLIETIGRRLAGAEQQDEGQ